MTHFLKKGFTLIELLVVIAIVGILAALMTTNLQGARERARDVRRKSDLQALGQSLRLYYNDAKQFPEGDATNTYQIKGCGTIAAPTDCTWGSDFATATSTYFNHLPTDPSSSSGAPVVYQYYSPDPDQFLLVATLENSSDPDISSSQSRCTSLYSSFNGTKDVAQDYLICAQ